MRRFTPLTILLLAFVAVLFSLFGGGSFSHLHSLEASLSRQQEINREMSERVANLKRQIINLQKDDRALEKTARTELGLARPDELIVIFDESKN